MLRLVVWYSLAVSVICNNILLYPELSGASGHIVPVAVGARGQILQMRIDFTRSDSFLYSEHHCPAFVSCLRHAGSIPGSLTEPVNFNGATTDVELDVVRDTNAIEDFTVENRECAGVLGFGPGSPLLASSDRITLSSEGGEDFEIRDIGPCPVVPDSKGKNVVRAHRSGFTDPTSRWSFDAMFKLGIFSLAVDVVFDPSETGILISRSAWYRLSAIIDRDAAPISVLTLAVKGMVLLDASQLLSVYDGQIELAMDVVEDDAAVGGIVVGTKLFANFYSVDLFPKAHLIRMNPRASDDPVRHIFEPPQKQWRVPLFSMAEPEVSHSVSITFRECSPDTIDSTTPLLMYNKRPKKTHDENNDVVGGWVFITLNPPAVKSPLSEEPRVLTQPHTEYLLATAFSEDEVEGITVEITATPVSDHTSVESVGKWDRVVSELSLTTVSQRTSGRTLSVFLYRTT